MANDTREDHGSYYPGAKVIVSGSGTSGTATDVSGKVDRVTIGEIGDAYTLKTVKEKVDKLIKAVAPVASCLAAMLCMSTAMAATEVLEDIPSNARVVISEDDPVALAAIPEAVGAATNAAVETAKTYADAAVAVEASNRVDDVKSVLVRSKSYTDTATNALAAKIPVVDLAPYATKSWVQSQGYLDSGSVDGVATKEWVSQQDFLTTLALTPYATIEWVIGRGYATPSVTNGLASMKWVEQKDYAAKSWVDGKGYTTPSVTNGLAGESWVMSRGFVTKSVTNGLATRTWVEQKDYATEKWVNDKGYVTKSVTNGLAGKTWVTSQGYVTKSVTNGLAAKTWVEQKGYLPSESAKRTYATKDELDALKRMYADTNGVTRIWSEDGLTMTDGTGVVWDVTWAAVTNWVSLTNGISYTMNGAANWIGDGIVTNAEGEVGVGRIWESSAMPGMYNFGLNGFDSFDITSPAGLLLSFDGVNMKPDSFTGVVERVHAFSFRSRIVTNAVGYVVSGTITDGTNTITAAGDATAVGIGKGYWMVRRIPDGAWRKLVPVPESDNALWRDVDTNSYVGDYSGAPDGMWTGSVDGFSNTFYIPAERYEAFSNSNAEGYYVPDRKTLATVDQIPTTPEQVGAAPASLAETVSAWQTYWDGDDVRVTVTNYYGNLDIPSLYLEQKMPEDETHDSPWFKVVWDERTRWNRFMPTFAALTNDVAQNKADRAWGVYDSSTGEYSPDGLLQLSQEQIMIAPGMSYQKTVTAGGNAYWILRANDPTTVSGVTSNGFFRIEDFDGNPLFEIVKGDKRIVGATSTSINAGSDGVTIMYNCVSDNPPELKWCENLTEAEWATVVPVVSGPSLAMALPLVGPAVEWTGSSGAWVALVKFYNVVTPPSAFFRATYETGGNTYIRNNVATSIDKVVVGGIEYTVTVETVNGKKLMVLQ